MKKSSINFKNLSPADHRLAWKTTALLFAVSMTCAFINSLLWAVAGVGLIISTLKVAEIGWAAHFPWALLAGTMIGAVAARYIVTIACKMICRKQTAVWEEIHSRYSKSESLPNG